jgi:hypothetical protein
MATLREIRTRISSVKSTQQITKANKAVCKKIAIGCRSFNRQG